MKINTTVDHFGKIVQGVLSDIGELYHTRVLDTQEQHIRQGLIALGWTPPIRTEQEVEYWYYWISEADPFGNHTVVKVTKGKPYHYKIAVNASGMPVGRLDDA